MLNRLNLSYRSLPPVRSEARAHADRSAPADTARVARKELIPRVLPGYFPDENGYTCLEGMDWTSLDQEYCTDGEIISYPELVVEGDSGGSSGGDTSGGGGSSGGSDSASDPNDPTNGPTQDPYEPLAEPNPAPLDDPVAKADVVELIRNACSNVSGVTLPGDDSRLGPYFEASVRKSLNSQLPSLRRFRWEGGDQDHPQLRLPVDGYAEAVTNDGVHVPGLVSSILEVKFTENPTDNLSSDQWKTHIEDLARYYSLRPSSDFHIGSPQYLLVTNSTYSDIANLGGDESYRIPQYAADRGVNVMHLRVTKDAYGRYSLSGDLVGTADVLNWIADLLKDAKVPFTVDCKP